MMVLLSFFSSSSPLFLLLLSFFFPALSLSIPFLYFFFVDFLVQVQPSRDVMILDICLKFLLHLHFAVCYALFCLFIIFFK